MTTSLLPPYPSACRCAKSTAATARSHTLRYSTRNIAYTAGSHTGFKRLRVVMYRLDAFLLFRQLVCQRFFLILRQPVHLLGFVFDQEPPADRPDHRRNAFEDEHFTPAEGVDQITGQHRHPQHRDRIAEDQERVGP